MARFVVAEYRTFICKTAAVDQSVVETFTYQSFIQESSCAAQSIAIA
jgi:hypothetical protein